MSFKQHLELMSFDDCCEVFAEILQGQGDIERLRK